ncbi:MAG: hypothetical protein V1779_11480 [bacterium]
MKIFALILAFITLSSMGVISQNRINSWDIGKISLIQIEIRTNDEKIDTLKIDNRKRIDSIFTFLKQIDFKTIESKEIDKNQILKHWWFRVSFVGNREQIWFCDEFATIGKTLFSIDRNVIRKFKKLVTYCKKC